MGSGTYAKFLEARGEGMHHISFTGDDIDTKRECLLEKGIKLADTNPRVFISKDGRPRAKYIAVHPRVTHGVAVEFNSRSLL
ncbi:VOC family protein [Chloroflexota bacterium]